MDPNVPPPPLPVPALPPLGTVVAPPQVMAPPQMMAQPMRVLPLGPGYPARRPGIISGIGVMSIIVASISILASLLTGCQSLMYQRIAMMSRTMNKPPMVVASGGAMPVQAAQATPQGNADVGKSEFTTGVHGLTPDNRAVVAQVLSEKRPMGPQRLRQLDAFLADQGQTAFPTGGDALTPTGVKASVTGDSEYAGGGDDDPGHTDFVTAWGTLKIYDSKTSFANGSGTAEVTADGIIDQAAQSSLVNSTTNTLTPAQVQTIVARVQKTSGNKLTPAQLASLTAALQDPNQQLVTPANAWSPIRSVMVNEGEVFVWLSDGFVTLDPQGKAQINPMNNGPPLKFSVNSKAFGLGELDAVVSLALAALLMVAGVCTLRQSPTARRYLLIYALVKIPLAILGTAALVWMNYEFIASASAGNSSGPQASGVAMVVAMIGGLGIVFPVALLLALQTRGAREYFGAARA
jgi:hypothetical protein